MQGPHAQLPPQPQPADIRAALAALYAQGSAAQQRADAGAAHAFLARVQTQTPVAHALPLADALLADACAAAVPGTVPDVLSAGAQEAFFGAALLQAAVSREWKAIPQEMRIPLRHRIQDLVVKFATAPVPRPFAIVVTKLCLALVSYALHAVTDGLWGARAHAHDDTGAAQPQSTFIVDFYTSVIRAHQPRPPLAHPDQTQQFLALEELGLEFLTVLPEEVSRADLQSTTRSQLTAELTSSIDFVFQVFAEVMSGSRLSGGIQVDSATIEHLRTKALRALQSWIAFGVSLRSLMPFIDYALTLLDNPATFETAADVVLELIDSPGAASYENTLCDRMLHLLSPASQTLSQQQQQQQLQSQQQQQQQQQQRQSWMMGEFMSCIRDPDENPDFLHKFTRLLTLLGETFPSFFIRNLGIRPDVENFLRMMLQCTSMAGYFPRDEEASEMTLDFWNVYAETLLSDLTGSIVDATISNSSASASNSFSVGEESRRSEDTHSKPNNTAHNDTNGERTAHTRALATDVLVAVQQALLHKLRFPPDNAYAQWTSDARDRLKVFRRDACDTMLSIQYFLRDRGLDVIVRAIIESSQGSDWQALEASLFSLRGVSESITSSESVYLPAFFSSLPSISSSPAAQHQRTQHTLCLVIGALSQWLRTHNEHLNTSLTFLVTALQNRECASSAASGFKELCDSCRLQLKSRVGDLVQFYGDIAPHLGPTEQGRVLEGLAGVMETIPLAEGLGLFVAVLGSVVGRVRAALTAARETRDPNEQRAARDAIVTGLVHLRLFIRGMTPHAHDDDDSAHEDVVELVETPASSPTIQRLSSHSRTKGLNDGANNADDGIDVNSNDAVTNAASAETLAMHMHISEEMVLMVGELVNAYAGDLEVVDAVCEVVNMSFKTDLPLFVLNLRALSERLVAFFAQTGNASIIHTFCSVFIAVPDGAWLERVLANACVPQNDAQTIKATVDDIFLAVLQNVSVSVARFVCGNEGDAGAVQANGTASTTASMDHPDIVAAYFGLLVRTLRFSPHTIARLPHDTLTLVFQRLLVSGLASEERVALRAVLEFLSEFVAENPRKLGGLNTAVVEQLGAVLARELIVGVATRHPRAMFPALAEPLFRLVSRHPENMRGWLAGAVAAAVPPARAQDVNVSTVVKQLMMTRQLKRFKEVVRVFGSKCRGYENTVM